jgi:hypothetical protein
MKMTKKQLIVIGVMVLSLQFTFFGCKAGVNRYYVANFDDDKSVELFASKFKEAVIEEERGKVASMIKYPIEATFKDKTVIINNVGEFLKLYDKILDKDLVVKISEFDTHNMWVNYQGVMLGDGDVWFGTSCTDCKDIKVIALGVCRRP